MAPLAVLVAAYLARCSNHCQAADKGRAYRVWLYHVNQIGAGPTHRDTISPGTADLLGIDLCAPGRHQLGFLRRQGRPC
jgi:hypothetical protein